MCLRRMKCGKQRGTCEISCRSSRCGWITQLEDRMCYGFWRLASGVLCGNPLAFVAIIQPFTSSSINRPMDDEQYRINTDRFSPRVSVDTRPFDQRRRRRRTTCCRRVVSSTWRTSSDAEERQERPLITGKDAQQTGLRTLLLLASLLWNEPHDIVFNQPSVCHLFAINFVWRPSQNREKCYRIFTLNVTVNLFN